METIEKVRINGSEPATGFSIPGDDKAGWHPGLTIRQEFAVRTMQGLMATLTPTLDNQLYPDYQNVKYMANLAVSAADILIEALNE